MRTQNDFEPVENTGSCLEVRFEKALFFLTGSHIQSR